MNKKGKITQIIGAVVDVNFENDLPEIYTALEASNGGSKLILEVEQHLGEHDVITIAMDATEGLKRGDEVVNTKAPISVPVGPETLGRIINVIGESIDEKGEKGLEEERRLAYVGITRAKKRAFISFSMKRFYQGDLIDSMASRFVEELPSKLIEKNTFYDEQDNQDNDFDFNQDFEIDETKRSPGWIRYQKRLKW